ncbi:unnamed protein product [Linum trigynum]|uniref:Uncharacterized protein n=1 Tax=Linum trigynum TaxID=586398 RepID=A0AAV2E0X6_9ROSI
MFGGRNTGRRNMAMFFPPVPMFYCREETRAGQKHDRVSAPYSGVSPLSAIFERESWVFGSQTPKGRPWSEREQLGYILGAILEDFFAIGARESSLEMEIEDLDQISAFSLFSME